MKYFLLPFKRYVDFSGRSHRKEYWTFVIIHTIIIAVLTAEITMNGEVVFSGFFGEIGNQIGQLYVLASLVPFLALGVRRLHDSNCSGWWMLINLIPFIGIIWFIVLVLKKSDAGANKYGEPSNA